MAIILNGTTGITTPAVSSTGGVGVGSVVTFPDNSTQATAATGFGFKNRIINGAMVIDARNAGASVTVNTSGVYSVDRFNNTAVTAGGGVFSAQQVSDAPSGFVNSLKITTTTAQASLAATDRFLVRQTIEGNNIADFSFGTASAKTITLSFWVKSSLTGTFGGSFQNASRNYVFSYNISSANTWEYKTVTATGCTDGTWLTDNGVGMRVTFSMGAGSTYLTTGGSWITDIVPQGVTGQVNVISTLSATWQVTGVQLEKGSTATSFDYRPYGTELALCQRYYWLVSNITYINQTTNVYNGTNVYFPATMRSTPSVTVYSTTTGTASKIRYQDGAADVNAGLNVQSASCTVFVNGVSTNFGSYMSFKFEASAEL